MLGLGCLRGLSLAVAGWGCSSLWCSGFSQWRLPSLRGTALGHLGFSSCSVRAQWLWRTRLGVSWHVASSWTRDRTSVPYIDRRILTQWASRKVPTFLILLKTESSPWLFSRTVLALTSGPELAWGWAFSHRVPLWKEHKQFYRTQTSDKSILIMTEADKTRPLHNLVWADKNKKLV